MQEIAIRSLSDSLPPMEKTNAADSEVALRAEFEALLSECGPLAYRVARSVLRNEADAEDVAQEALLRAFRRFERLRDKAKFRSWLVRIAFRLSLDRWRSRKRRESRESAWMNETLHWHQVAPDAEFQARLERALSELPDKFRLVLSLCAMEGHTAEEVAAILQVPPGTVKSRLFFARKKLAEKLR